MKTIRSTLIAATLLLVGMLFTARAQEPSVGGWRQAKWGMTPAEVETAFNGEASKPRQGQFSKTNILLTIPQVDIEGAKFVAAFFFDGGKLTQVILQSSDGSDSLYQNIFQRLVEKYGQPSYSHNCRTESTVGTDVMEKRAWNRGETRVEWKFQTFAVAAKIWTLSYSRLQLNPNL